MTAGVPGEGDRRLANAVTAEVSGPEAEVQLGHLCNNRCVFCSSGLLTEVGLARPLPVEPMLEALADARRRGARRVTFVGGEPTIQRSFLAALAHARSLGFEEIVVFTDGVMLPRPEFLESVVAAAGRVSWRVSIQGGDEAAHDASTGRKGSFRRLMDGLPRVAALGHEITVNLCANTHNFRSLPSLAGVVTRFPVRQVHVDVVRPRSTGFADGAPAVRNLEHLRAIMPRYSEMVPYFRRMLDGFETIDPAFDVNVGNLPYCVMPDRAGRIHHGGEPTVTTAASPRDLQEPIDKYAWHYDQRRYLPSCERCALRPRCSGIFAEYLDLYGDEEFRPIEVAASGPRPPAPVSNSFDYVAVKRLPGFRLDRRQCSARDLGLSHVGSSRLLVAVVEGDAVLCRTKTTDFTDADVRHAVHGRGQLYRDVSAGPEVVDFRDLQPLVLSDECLGCADLPTCTGAYVPLAGPSRFEADEEMLRRRVAGLRGRVLDVGMGQLPFLEAAAPAIRDGSLEYHGIDPDGDVIERATATGLPLHLRRVRVEDLSPAEGPFDEVIAIRSLHHVEDLETAFRVMTQALRPGGRLLLVESIALPVLRTRAAAERARREAGGFQHYRNWSSEQLLAWMNGRFPVRVMSHRPVSRETCDQWILELERVERT